MKHFIYYFITSLRMFTMLLCLDMFVRPDCLRHVTQAHFADEVKKMTSSSIDYELLRDNKHSCKWAQFKS